MKVNSLWFGQSLDFIRCQNAIIETDLGELAVESRNQGELRLEARNRGLSRSHFLAIEVKGDGAHRFAPEGGRTVCQALFARVLGSIFPTL